MKLLLRLALIGAALSARPLGAVLQTPNRPANAPPASDARTQSGETRREWPWGTEQEAERIRTQVLGTWRLVSVRRSAQTFDGAACQGYMLVQPEHLSLQTRLSSPSGALRDVFIEGFSTGVYRWRYDSARLKLAISTLMAANDFNGDLEWEPAGAQREYDVLVDDNLMTLTRTGEAVFEFARVRPTVREK